jgi:hypothetical protein
MSDEAVSDNKEIVSNRQEIFGLLDDYIENIQKARKIMLGVSLSAIVLAPMAITLSSYLLLHPSFSALLDREDEFGDALSILLGAVIIVSIVWFVTGIRQYFAISKWKDRYESYKKGKEEMDRKIITQYGLTED